MFHVHSPAWQCVPLQRIFEDHESMRFKVDSSSVNSHRSVEYPQSHTENQLHMPGLIHGLSFPDFLVTIWMLKDAILTQKKGRHGVTSTFHGHAGRST